MNKFVVSIFFRPDNQVPKWYKFDDGDVSECKMDDDEVKGFEPVCDKYSVMLKDRANLLSAAL